MPPNLPPVAIRNSRLTGALPLLLAVLAAYFFAVRVRHGIWFVGFVDESEHLLGGKMLNAGAVLYRTFVTQHGPVTFMLTQAYGAIFGWRHANGARLISAALALDAAACVATTPALPDRVARLWAAALFLGLTASVWLLQGLYLVNYHAIAGFLLVAALALCVVPAWRGAAVDRGRAFAAGACAMLVIATAYSFGPAIVLLGASTIWALGMGPSRASRLAVIAGAAAGALGVLAWLLIFGDVTGYLAFHFAENQFFFIHFMEFTFDSFLRTSVPSLQPRALVQAIALICWLVSFCLLLAMNMVGSSRQLIGPILLGCAGVLTQSARGGIFFQNGSFLIGSIGVLSMALPAAIMRCLRVCSPIGLAVGSLLVGLCIVGAELAGRHAVTSPVRITRAQMADVPHSNLGRSPDAESARIRALVRPDERMLVVPYAPGVYMAADRSPMDRYFYYLPWDAAYAKAPWFGQTHDLCVDLPKAPPRLIYFDDWKVWGHYYMHDYMPCFVTILNAQYRRQADFPNLYLRIDHVLGDTPSP
jgi:hypothetical protein